MGLAALTLSSCAQVTINDEEVFALNSPGNGAFYAHTLSTAQGSISESELNQMRPGLFCMSAASFGDLKNVIEQLCSFNPNECNYAQVDAAVARLALIHKKAKKK